jgi:hypothetical protein
MARPSDDDDLDWDGEDDQAEGPSAKGPAWLDGIRSALLRGATSADRPKLSTKSAIDKLDVRERRFSFAAAGASMVFGTMVYLLDTHNPHFRLAKGQITPQTTLVLGFVCAALLLASTFYGRRAAVGFVALFTFLMFGTSSFFLGAPFLALAIWLLYRSYKIQKEVADAKRAARAEEPVGRSSSSRSAATSSKSSKSSVGSSRKKGPVRPEANKRYTPKRPPPPAPKPSRRERKAERASD